MSRSRAFTLIEVLIVVGVIALLIGLLLPAVQKVREAAARSMSQNNIKQLILAVHNFAGDHDGRLPVLDGNEASPNPRQSLFIAILPYVEQQAVYRSYLSDLPSGKTRIKLFLSPADPTLTDANTIAGVSSYAPNAFAFQEGFSLAAGFSDGTSNTIAFGEHYAYCNNHIFTFWVWNMMDYEVRRASFADGGPVFQQNYGNYGDMAPIDEGSPPTARPSYPHPTLGFLTFQVAPAVKDCYALAPQTPHPSGMLSAMMDGSLRTISPSVSNSVFWGAVTPSGGEVLGDW